MADDWFKQNAPVAAGGDWFQQNSPSDNGLSVGGVLGAMADQGSRAVGAAWENFNPVQTAKALLPWNARDTAGKLLGATTDAVGRTREALNNKNYKEAGLSALGAIPLVGPPVEQVSRDVAAGNFPEAIGHVGGIAAMGELPRMIPPIVRGVPAAAAATKAAAKAGGGDIAAGTLKTGAGFGLAKSGIIGDFADALMGAPLVAGGIKQAAGGVRSAYEAAKGSLAKSRYEAIPKGPGSRWAGPSPTIIPPPDFVPTPATELPSGKIPGSITNQAPLDVSIPMRPSPRWAGIEPTIAPPPDFVPTPAAGLPSGRVPGSISSQSPLENIPKSPTPVEDVGRLDDLAKSLSGKKFSKLDDARKQAVIDIAERLKRQGKPSIPAPPGMQSPVDTSQVPVSNPPSAGAVPFKGHDAQMTDLIRQFHAQWPKGTSLRDISSDVFGTKGAVPNYEQALKIHEYMLKNNGKIPTAGDLK